MTRGVSLKLHAGEILGIAGLVGSGRSELAEVIFGMTPAEERHDPGRRQAGDRSPAPRDAKHLGIAYVPEDRGRQGLVRPMPIIAERLACEPLACRAEYVHRPQRRERAGGEERQGIPDPRERHRPDRRKAVGRQPAEGRAVEMARDKAAHPHHGRADARHRRRRQGRDPSADGRIRAGKAWRSS